MDAIVTESLTRSFGDHIAVKQLDLTVAQGEVFGFLGPNGAGKTTTVRLLNGVLNATAGRANVLGFDVATHGADIRKRTGVLTETPNLYETLTARENLQFFGDLYGVDESELPQRVASLLGDLGLIERADERVAGYSKGMKQRLAIARALLHQPALLFLDEPTSGLDPVAARLVTSLIQTLSRQEGRTVFLCTHNLTEAQRLCHRVGVIDQGVLRALGTPKQLAQQLWQKLRIEIDLHGEPIAEVQQALRRIPHVLGHDMEDGLLVLELDAEESIPDVISAISAAGGRIFQVTPRQHTLEEIYFEIQGNHRGSEGGVG